MPARLSAEVKAEIEKALLEEVEIVQDPDLPISSYNYTVFRVTENSFFEPERKNRVYWGL